MDTRTQAQIDDLAHLFYYKGYRKNFELEAEDIVGQPLKGQLIDVLTTYIGGKVIDPSKVYKFQINTYAEYLSSKDYKQCYCRAEYCVRDGFTLRQMDLISRNPSEQRVFRLRSNHELLPVQSAIGYFPRPKPWNDAMKGRFPRI